MTDAKQHLTHDAALLFKAKDKYEGTFESSFYPEGHVKGTLSVELTSSTEGGATMIYTGRFQNGWERKLRARITKNKNSELEITVSCYWTDISPLYFQKIELCSDAIHTDKESITGQYTSIWPEDKGVFVVQKVTSRST